MIGCEQRVVAGTAVAGVSKAVIYVCIDVETL